MNNKSGMGIILISLVFLLASCGANSKHPQMENTLSPKEALVVESLVDEEPGEVPGEEPGEEPDEEPDEEPISLHEKVIGMKLEENATSSVALCRGWHGSPVVGSGYNDRYLFLEDGSFYFAANQMSIDRLRYMDGEWACDEDIVKLTVKRKIVIEGGKEEAGDGSMIKIIVGGDYVKVDHEPDQYELLEYRLTFFEPDSDVKTVGIIIGMILGEQQFWGSQGVDYDELLSMWDINWGESFNGY